MRATLIYGAGDVRVETVPDPKLQEPTDAVVRILRSCVCGTDLHPYRAMPTSPEGVPMGHEFLGIIEDVGSDVATLRHGDVVIAPFAYSDGTCEFCQQGLQTACVNGGFFAMGEVGGAQAEALRVPLADGTLVKIPDTIDDNSPLLPSLLTLSDVFATGHHTAIRANVNPRTTVAVIGDGAVGLSAVLAAKRLGAERIILMGRHTDRTDLGREFGATDIVTERGTEGIEKVHDLTGGGVHAVLEAVGYRDAYDTAIGIVRAGGIISRAGVPQYNEAPIGFESLFFRGITLTGGPTPVRAYIEELLPDILNGTINPGRVFDHTAELDQTPDAYRAMNDRQSIKVLLRP
jgi:threonine dehydrogenase-like Zn-dependent dehydrogenase